MKIIAIVAIAACALLSACAGDRYGDNGYRSPIAPPLSQCAVIAAHR